MFDLVVSSLRKLALRLLLVVIIITGAAVVAIGVARAEDQQVDANVITALDVSTSINAVETILQVEGMADAVRSPAFVAAASQGRHGRIGFLVFVWADGNYPELVSWRVVGTQAEANAVSVEIQSKLQSLIQAAPRGVGTLTNISGALEHANQLVQEAPFRAERDVVNIIGNGEDNVGEDPQRARAALLAMGVTVNGVVVGGDPEVLRYFRTFVVGGKGAFTLTIGRAEDLTTMMVSKFVADLAMVTD
jgi:Protein of unknown function (DUF1194)